MSISALVLFAVGFLLVSALKHFGIDAFPFLLFAAGILLIVYGIFYSKD